MIKAEFIARTKTRLTQLTVQRANLRNQRRQIVLTKPINMRLVNELADNIRNLDMVISRDERLIKRCQRGRAIHDLLLRP
jgi:hypothetical protein